MLGAYNHFPFFFLFLQDNASRQKQIPIRLVILITTTSKVANQVYVHN